MLKFLLFIFFIFFLIILMAGVFIRNIAQTLFGRNTKRSQNHEQHHRSEDRNTSSHHQDPQNKIFDKNEGEYVDYEEVK